MNKGLKIGLLTLLWIWTILIYLFIGFRTGRANFNVAPWYVGPLLSIPVWFLLKKKKFAVWLYPILLIILFIPTIPMYFTYLNYSNTVLRDILLTLFLAICIASLLHKGIINKSIALILMFGIAFFSKGNYGRYHNIHDTKIHEIRFDDYSLSLYKFNIRSECDYDTHWRGRKYMMLGLLYDYALVHEQSIDDTCKSRFFIEYEHRHFSDKKSERRVIEYNFCSKQTSFETQRLMLTGEKLNFNPNQLKINPSIKTFQDKRCKNGIYGGPYFTYNYYYTILELDTIIKGSRTYFASQPIYTDSLTLKQMLLKTKTMTIYFDNADIKNYYFDFSFLDSRAWRKSNDLREQRESQKNE
jgi:hypothetical protein